MLALQYTLLTILWRFPYRANESCERGVQDETGQQVRGQMVGVSVGHFQVWLLSKGKGDPQKGVRTRGRDPIRLAAGTLTPATQ